MKLLITGTKGRLGAALVAAYASRHEIVCVGRSELDLSVPERISPALGRLDFDLVIHCAAITSPDACERAPELATCVNAISPAVIASECRRRGARMIQISTDYVYGGDNQAFLTESMTAMPVNHYGRTKLEAERGVLRELPEALVARVSWLFGSGSSFPDQILKQARGGSKLEAIADKWSAPTSVHDIAVWLERLWQHEKAPTGVINLCNSGSATWQSYGQTIIDLAVELQLLPARLEVEPNKLEDFTHFIARRPRFTTMSNKRLSGLLGAPIRSWQEALKEWLCALSA